MWKPINHLTRISLTKGLGEDLGRIIGQSLHSNGITVVVLRERINKINGLPEYSIYCYGLVVAGEPMACVLRIPVRTCYCSSNFKYECVIDSSSLLPSNDTSCWYSTSIALTVIEFGFHGDSLLLVGKEGLVALWHLKGTAFAGTLVASEESTCMHMRAGSGIVTAGWVRGLSDEFYLLSPKGILEIFSKHSDSTLPCGSAGPSWFTVKRTFVSCDINLIAICSFNQEYVMAFGTLGSCDVHSCSTQNPLSIMSKPQAVTLDKGLTCLEWCSILCNEELATKMSSCILLAGDLVGRITIIKLCINHGDGTMCQVESICPVKKVQSPLLRLERILVAPQSLDQNSPSTPNATLLGVGESPCQCQLNDLLNSEAMCKAHPQYISPVFSGLNIIKNITCGIKSGPCVTVNGGDLGTADVLLKYDTFW